MLYIEDLKEQIAKKLLSKGFVYGGKTVDNKLMFPFVQVAVENDTPGGSKKRSFNHVTINIEIIANGDDEVSSNINNLQYDAMMVLIPLAPDSTTYTKEEIAASQYVGDEHYIEFQGMGTIQYLSEDDENFNIYRRILPCTYLIQSNKF